MKAFDFFVRPKKLRAPLMRTEEAGKKPEYLRHILNEGSAPSHEALYCILNP